MNVITTNINLLLIISYRFIINKLLQVLAYEFFDYSIVKQNNIIKGKIKISNSKHIFTE